MAFGSVNVPGDLSGKQNKLTGLPGQAIILDGAGNAAAVRGWSNQNMLRNWYFLSPINSLNAKSSNKDGYTFIDGWRVSTFGDSVLTVEPDGIHMQTGQNATSTVGITQYIDGNLVGKECTFSVLDNKNNLISATAILEITGGWNISHSAADSWLGVRCESEEVTRATITTIENTLVAAKLELGPVQTLAHKDAHGNWVLNDPPPDPALERAKCQRYLVVYDFYVMYGAIQASGLISPVDGSTRAILSLPTEMRIQNPAISITGEPLYVQNMAKNKSFKISRVNLSQLIGNSLRIGFNLESMPTEILELDSIAMRSAGNAKLIIDANNL